MEVRTVRATFRREVPDRVDPEEEEEETATTVETEQREVLVVVETEREATAFHLDEAADQEDPRVETFRTHRRPCSR